MLRSVAVLLGWIGGLALAVAAGHALGGGVLAVPGAEVGAWGVWATTTDPLIVTMALLRLLAVGVAWYLLATTAVGVVARGLRAVRFVALADAISVPVVRRVLQRGMGVVVATAVVTAAAPPAVGAADPPPVAVVEEAPGMLTMRGITPSGGEDRRAEAEVPVLPWQRFASEGTEVPQTPPGGPITVPSPSTVASPEEVAPSRPDRAPAALVSEERGPAAPGEGSHTVSAGESLWRISEVRLAAVLGRQPQDAEVVPYWREVIERNRVRLVVADDPDLILPGQVLVLPAVGDR